VNNSNNARNFAVGSPGRYASRALRWLGAFAMAAAVAACGGGGGSSAAEDLVALSHRQDAASCSYEHLYVTVERVRVLQAMDGQWIDLAPAAPVRIDLLDTSDGLLQALGIAPLASGHYTDVRLVLASSRPDGSLANAVHASGADPAPLMVPSGAQAGLKLKGELHVTAGQSGDLVLQGFDPCEAVVQTARPGSPSYLLKPELSASLHSAAAAAETPIATGTVVPLLDGGFVVSRLEGTHTWTVQRYGADGQPAGTVTTVTASMGLNDSDLFTTVTPLTGGGYVVTWLSSVEFGSFGYTIYDVFAQSFTPTGAPVGSPSHIAQTQPARHWISRPPAWPQVAALADGGYVVVWGLQPTTDTGVYAQRFDASGTPAGAVQQVTPDGSGALGVTGLPIGGYIVTWGTGLTSTGGVRAYGADGLPLGPEQSAGPTWGMLFYQGDAAATSPLAGGAVIAWVQRAATSLHPVQGIMVQRLATDGTPLGSATMIDESGLSPEAYGSTAVAGLPDGGYVVAWIGGGEVHARRFAADGTPAGTETLVNLVTTAAQGPVAVVVMVSGGFMVTWSGVGTDGIRRNYARRFPANGLLAT
jgi:hypothetical protein